MPQPQHQESSAAPEDNKFYNYINEKINIMENRLISHIDQRFDNLSQLITKQQPTFSNVSTQDEFEISEEPTMAESNLKPNDYPPSIVRQLFAEKLLSDSYPSTNVDAAFNVFYKKCYRVLESFEQSQNCNLIDLPTWSNISHFQRDKLCQIAVNAARKKMEKLSFIDDCESLWPAQFILKTVWAQKVKNIRTKTLKEIGKQTKSYENIALSSKFTQENTVLMEETDEEEEEE
jgi:hypothetical protein